jgi:hypothetical protein
MTTSIRRLDIIEGMARQVETVQDLVNISSSRQQELLAEVKSSTAMRKSSVEKLSSHTQQIVQISQQARDQTFDVMLGIISLTTNLKRLMLLRVNIKSNLRLRLANCAQHFHIH